MTPPADPRADDIRHFHTLDVLRGLAALSVVLYHWQHFFYDGTRYVPFDHDALPLPHLLGLLYTRGWLAVDLFFGISGFIFHEYYARAIASHRVTAGRFAWLRLTRLYPLHLLTLLLVIVLQVLYAARYGGHYMEGAQFVYPANDPLDFGLHLLLLTWMRDSAGDAFNGPVWSISVEVVLYALFFLACRRLPRRTGILVALAIAGFAVASATNSPIARGVGSFFLGGCMQAAFVALARSPQRTRLTAWLVAGTALLWLIVYGVASSPAGAGALQSFSSTVAPLIGAQRVDLVVNKLLPRVLPILVLFPLTILSLALLQAVRPGLCKRWSVIGDLSYSSYLLHFPLQLVAVLLFGTARMQPDGGLYTQGWFMIAFFLALILLSTASFRLYERPVQQRLRRWFESRRLPQTAGRLITFLGFAVLVAPLAQLAAPTAQAAEAVPMPRAAKAAQTAQAPRAAEPAQPPSPAIPSGKRRFGDSLGLVMKFYQGQPADTLNMVTRLGVRWVRDGVSWTDIEKTPGHYDAFPADFAKRLQYYRDNDVGVIYTLAYDNTVAYPPTKDEPLHAVDPQAFARYAVAAAKMLRQSGVRFVLEIWNEPHNFVLKPLLGGEWNGKAPSPWVDHYLKMVRETVRQVKAFDPRIRLMTDDDMWVLHYWFLQGGLPKNLDAIAFHPYTTDVPERTVVKFDTDWTQPFHVVDADQSFRSAVRRLTAQARAKLGRAPEMWITEWGWATGADKAKGEFPEDTVAAYLPRAYIGAFAAGVQVTCWFSAFDASDGPMGLLTHDGRERASLRAFRTMSDELGRSTLVRQIGRSPVAPVQAYLFQEDGGSPRIVAWALDQPAFLDLTPIPADERPLAVDVYGRRVSPSRDAQGRLGLPLGIAPLYLAPPGGTAALERQLARAAAGD